MTRAKQDKLRLPVWRVQIRGRTFLVPRLSAAEAETRARKEAKVPADVPVHIRRERGVPSHVNITRTADGKTWRVCIDDTDILELSSEGPPLQ